MPDTTTDRRAWAINDTGAAIAVEGGHCLHITATASYLCVMGVENLQALRDAIDYALGAAAQVQREREASK